MLEPSHALVVLVVPRTNSRMHMRPSEPPHIATYQPMLPIPLVQGGVHHVGMEV